jgi:hypothetical protein
MSTVCPCMRRLAGAQRMGRTNMGAKRPIPTVVAKSAGLAWAPLLRRTLPQECPCDAAAADQSSMPTILWSCCTMALSSPVR